MRTTRSATAATTLAAGLLLAAVGTAAAQASDSPAAVQDAAEIFRGSVNDIQVGLVNIQDVSDENENPTNALNQSDISSSTGDQA